MSIQKADNISAFISNRGKKDHERHKKWCIERSIIRLGTKTGGNKIKDLSEFRVLPRAKTDNILFIEG